MGTLYTVYDSQYTDRVANWWKEGSTRMSLGAHRADCVVFHWQPHKQLTVSVIFFTRSGGTSWYVDPTEWGVGDLAWMCTVLQTSCCVVNTALDTHIETSRQINSTESCFALHTRTLSTAALHFIHGHYQQLFCTSFTDTIDSCFTLQLGHYRQLFCTSYTDIMNSCFALHTRTLSTAVLHFIHGHYQQLFFTSYTDIINSCFALPIRTLSTAVLHFLHGHYQQLFCTSYTDIINSCFTLHTRTLSTAVLHFIHGHYQQLFCTSYTDFINSCFALHTRTLSTAVYTSYTDPLHTATFFHSTLQQLATV
jgi:hypothetical protein